MKASEKTADDTITFVGTLSRIAPIYIGVVCLAVLGRIGFAIWQIKGG